MTIVDERMDNNVDYININIGETFIVKNVLYINTSVGAVNLKTGHITKFEDSVPVTPVNVIAKITD